MNRSIANPVMKICVILFVILAATNAMAQPGYITTVAGNGSVGYSGDGGPATAASTWGPAVVCADAIGNFYFCSGTIFDYKIRKVNTAGTIDLFAGGGTSTADGVLATDAAISPGPMAVDANNNLYFIDSTRIRKVDISTGTIITIAGSSAYGFAGDGGPATAALLDHASGLCFDHAGNMYICTRHRIRKINTSGIITTIAGSATPGFSGDGGPATSALLSYPAGICVDYAGNIYIADNGNNRVRKINAAGIISTYAGNGLSSPAGDGSPATNAAVAPANVSIDAYGNLYIAEGLSIGQIRKVDRYGIITTVAGNGTVSTLSSIPATSAQLTNAHGLSTDKFQNIYVTDQSLSRICKVEVTPPTIMADSFVVYINPLCAGPEINIISLPSGTSIHQVTYFGDGTSNSTSLAAGASLFSHVYGMPGTYTLKTVLMNGSVAIDSATYSYQYKMCNVLQAKFYIDRNSNGVYDDGADPLCYYPVTVEVDSNGIAIDTMSTTSGFYYTAYGLVGDVYKLKIIDITAGLLPSSPLSGELITTLTMSNYNADISYFGMACSGAPGNSFNIHAANRCGYHAFTGTLLVGNLHCSVAGEATVAFSMSPKYQHPSADPSATVTSGNTLIWHFSGLSGIAPPNLITINAEKPALVPAYLPGDTVHSRAIIGPFTGDTDTMDNITNPVDTVKSGYDPNFILVNPAGYIPSGTRLEYTIGFENTGNDTAYNIYILDTLSDNVDPSSLTIVAASAAMDIYKFTSGGHSIVKFDFPHINLLDSSHHNLCHGMLVYTVKTKAGLPDCTHIQGRAGIYFDENPVVMTNTVENIIGLAPAMAAMSGPGNVCPGSSISIAASLPGGTWSVSNGNASVLAGNVTGVADGYVFVYYSLPAACGPVLSQFLVKVGAPDPGFIVSSNAICEGSSFTLTATVPGGVWSLYNTNASLVGSVITGVTPGSDTVYYSVSSACGTGVAQQVISIDTIVHPAPVTGATTLCEGASITVGNTTLGGVWSVCNDNAVVTASGLLTGLAQGTDSVVYTYTNGCGSYSSALAITILPASACWPVSVSNTIVSRDIVIFPNPVTDELTIKLDANQYQTLSITNSVGQALLHIPISGNTTHINTNYLPGGVYYITLIGNNGSWVGKFLKM
jgi:uncharacterized repeat protein (TIGR01451 family)